MRYARAPMAHLPPDTVETERSPPARTPAPARRERSPRRDGARTTLRVPLDLATTVGDYAEQLGTTPNDALIRLAERGAASYEREREVERLAAERRTAVLSVDPPDPDAEYSSSEWVDWAMRSARGEE